MKQVVILAGGKGTRLRERLGGLPKPLVDLCGVPLLERQLALAQRHGFGEALILVNHAAERIVEYCAARRNAELEVSCLDDGVPRGTAGATLAAFERLASEFLVMYGDTMLEVDLARFHSYHAEVPAAAATLYLHPNDHPQDSDLVELDDLARIVAFHPYPRDASPAYANLVNAGLYWVRREALAPWRGEQRALDFGKDLFPAMLARGSTLRGFRGAEYIKDIGTPSRLDSVRADYLAGKIARASLERRQPMVFIDRDGTIGAGTEDFELLPGAAQAIRRLNSAGYRCCVLAREPGRTNDTMETLLGREGAFVERIYSPAAQATIERAAREFNMARERSWLVGDASLDIETARHAGLKSVLVETGCAGLDYRAWATPDAIVPDLAAAVSFILERQPRLFSDCRALAERIGEAAIVLVGGQARSGKSTFANLLADAIRASGKSAVVLCADRWLRNAHERGPGVFGRFDMQALQALLEALEPPRPRARVLSLPGYHKLRRERIDAVETVSVSPSDIIVVEGIVALGLHPAGSTETHRFHIEIDEAARRQRMLGEYGLRSMSAAEALKVYLARRQDEFPLIEALAAGARRLSLA